LKVLFIILLILNFLFEALAGLSLIAGPGGIGAAGQGEQWAMHYGFAALAVASVSLWAWPQRGALPAVTATLGVLLVFHTGLCASLAIAGDQQAGMIVHGVLAAMCAAVLSQRSKVCAIAQPP